MKNILHKLMNALGRYRLIPDRRTGADYMHRYYLLCKNRRWFPFNVTLHKIVRSDDPIFHDHPWPYLTIILKGGYWEHVPLYDEQGNMFGEVSKWRGPGSIIKRSATAMHWLELDMGKPATTLFFMGKQEREWGFLVRIRQTKPKWVHYQTYLKDWQKYHNKYIVNNK
jgi:hypothetical protein